MNVHKIINIMSDAAEKVSAELQKSSGSGKHNMAVVFDIDETLIDLNEQRIEPVYALYRYCLNAGLHLFIVTARTIHYANETHTELAEHEITGYIDAYFRKSGEVDVGSFKLNSRKHIHERGYVVIMSIGDQETDFGLYGGHGVLVPSD